MTSALDNLAALRRAGYRSTNRDIVFQVLPHALGLGPQVCGYSRSVMTCETGVSTRAIWSWMKDWWLT